MILSKTQPGIPVLILADVRDGIDATGQIGTYEGAFPRSVALYVDGQGIGFFDYNAFAGGHLTAGEVIAGVPNNEPAKDVFAVWEFGEPKPDARCVAIVDDNPRIRLPDGSVIWGDECWWQEHQLAIPN